MPMDLTLEDPERALKMAGLAKKNQAKARAEAEAEGSMLRPNIREQKQAESMKTMRRP